MNTFLKQFTGLLGTGGAAACCLGNGIQCLHRPKPMQEPGLHLRTREGVLRTVLVNI